MSGQRRHHSMSVLVVMHDWLAPAGVLGEAILERGGRYTTVLPQEGYCSDAPHERRGLPADPSPFDAMLVLGGAMAATDDARCPHFPQLLVLLRAFHALGKPVLGVCLGAQLVARAFGAAVAPQGFLEFGFNPISLTDAGRLDPLLEGLEPHPWIMQWHEDRFCMPPGGALLATNTACSNQIVRIGATTYGFQCHLEVTVDIARSWVRARKDQIVEQHPGFFERFEAQIEERAAAAMTFGRAVGERFVDLIEASRRAPSSREKFASV